jgi:hypothetical protein
MKVLGIEGRIFAHKDRIHRAKFKLFGFIDAYVRRLALDSGRLGAGPKSSAYGIQITRLAAEASLATTLRGIHESKSGIFIWKHGLWWIHDEEKLHERLHCGQNTAA